MPPARSAWTRNAFITRPSPSRKSDRVMKRASIVLAGTAVGLTGVLSYHVNSTPAAGSSNSSAGQTTTPKSTSTTAGATASASATSTSSSSSSSSAKKASTRAATGQDVAFRYGDIQLKVTVSGSHITKVSVVQL